MIARDSRIRLSELDDFMNGDNVFAEAALHVLKKERPLDTHTAATAGKALIQHWLEERELKCYAHGREIDYLTEVGKDTVFPDEKGDYGLAQMAVEHDRIIDRVELKALIHTWGMPMPIRLKDESPSAPEQANSETQEGSASTEGKPRHRLDNLGRAVLDALNHLPPAPTVQQVFDYLVKKDETGYVRGRDGDELTWINGRGEQSRTSKKSLANRLPRLIREHEGAQ